ncbi:hypothetical protein HAX54_049115 [Datura stramonium]|uniref:Uncharacterized protein n=1 Tax=Datura stramonium TaxID=4076 RepID=A0ABS8WMB8_DATST|nr:hypothetical protein [Datura stramonium]
MAKFIDELNCRTRSGSASISNPAQILTSAYAQHLRTPSERWSFGFGRGIRAVESSPSRDRRRHRPESRNGLDRVNSVYLGPIGDIQIRGDAVLPESSNANDKPPPGGRGCRIVDWLPAFRYPTKLPLPPSAAARLQRP